LCAVPVIQRGSHVATVIASVSLAPYERAEHTAVIGSAIVAMLLLAGAYPVLRVAGRRAMQPVERMTHQAGEWSAHAPAHRFGGGQHFAELQDLASTLDGVLDRLSAVLRHERQLSAELSHELRTPLSTIVAEADLLLARNPNELAYRSIHASAMSMNEIIETLLTAARAELQSDVAACDVRAVVERVVAGRREHITVRDIHRPIAGVDDRLLTRLLSPIIDNAVRYARDAVIIDIARDASAVVVEVANDGPPIAPGDHDRIFDAGYSDGDGLGLGLALARRLARAADGDVVSVPRTDGAAFRITLPPG
jgi:signal transduction histidine kinase